MEAAKLIEKCPQGQVNPNFKSAKNEEDVWFALGAAVFCNFNFSWLAKTGHNINKGHLLTNFR